MSQFIERIRRSDGYEHCGRILRDGGDLLVFIDEVGRFTLPVGGVTAVILGMGSVNLSGPSPGSARLSESGKGLHLDIGGEIYVIPVSRVRTVIDGVHRKGPVSRVVRSPV